MKLFLIFILGLFIGGIRKKTLMRGEEKYLIRISLFKCKWFSIKLHKALMSDPAIPHDHPWNYISLILWGGYTEERIQHMNVYTSTGGPYERTFSMPWNSKKWYGPGSILYRKGDRLHKLIIPEGKYSLSLIITFKKWREWGFYDFYKGWVSHKEKDY